jgi:hypothetical protein
MKVFLAWPFQRDDLATPKTLWLDSAYQLHRSHGTIQGEFWNLEGDLTPIRMVSDRLVGGRGHEGYKKNGADGGKRHDVEGLIVHVESAMLECCGHARFDL